MNNFVFCLLPLQLSVETSTVEIELLETQRADRSTVEIPNQTSPLI